jgi:hypothetical protein
LEKQGRNILAQQETISLVSSQDWERGVALIATTARSFPDRLQTCVSCAVRIQESVTTVSQCIEEICRKTCPVCTDICCRRATIGYDVKDLLYLQLAFNRLPQEQIFRISDKRGLLCSNLSADGCVLPRTQRPFVCTWYFCPDQTRMLRKEDPGLLDTIDKTLHNIKSHRRYLLSEFTNILKENNR